MRGRYEGRRVWVRFSRENGCHIARWNRLRLLFPIRVGVLGRARARGRSRRAARRRGARAAAPPSPRRGSRPSSARTRPRAPVRRRSLVRRGAHERLAPRRATDFGRRRPRTVGSERRSGRSSRRGSGRRGARRARAPQPGTRALPRRPRDERPWEARRLGAPASPRHAAAAAAAMRTAPPGSALRRSVARSDSVPRSASRGGSGSAHITQVKAATQRTRNAATKAASRRLPPTAAAATASAATTAPRAHSPTSASVRTTSVNDGSSRSRWSKSPSPPASGASLVSERRVNQMRQGIDTTSAVAPRSAATCHRVLHGRLDATSVATAAHASTSSSLALRQAPPRPRRRGRAPRAPRVGSSARARAARARGRAADRGGCRPAVLSQHRRPRVRSRDEEHAAQASAGPVKRVSSAPAPSAAPASADQATRCSADTVAPPMSAKADAWRIGSERRIARVRERAEVGRVELAGEEERLGLRHPERAGVPGAEPVEACSPGTTPRGRR